MEDKKIGYTLAPSKVVTFITWILIFVVIAVIIFGVYLVVVR